MFQVFRIGCQNIFIETLIRVTKFSHKIPRRCKFKNNIQTKFQPSGAFPRTGMHTLSLFFVTQVSVERYKFAKLNTFFYKESEI